MNLPRRNPALNDAVELLDHYYDLYKGDVNEAYIHLSALESQFIDDELARCIQDPRYYLENYHVVQTEHEGLKTLYPFWESQEIIYHKIRSIQLDNRPVRLAILKARQQGSSTLSEGLVFHKAIFTGACNTLIVAQDTDQADYLFGMSRLAYDSLPWWMRPERRYEAKGRFLVFDRKDDMERLRRPGLKSNIFVEASNKMTGVARGKTLRAAHMSELASWMDGGMLSQSIFPTMNAPDELAIMESTAEGRTGFWYQFWKDCVDGNLEEWDHIFIEFFRVKKYSRPIKNPETFKLTDEEKALREKVARKSGFDVTNETFNWRRIKIKEFIALEGDEWKFYQEYPSDWMEAFQGSGVCAFPKKLLHRILNSTCCNPVSIGEIDYETNPAKRERFRLNLRRLPQNEDPPPAKYVGNRLWVWEEPMPEDTYYVSADVAHGLEGGDYSCAQVMKIGHGTDPDEQVAEWHGWINPTDFAYVVSALGYWYNTAQVAVECNDVGSKTDLELTRVIEYDNIFIWKNYDKVKHFYSDFRGWYTNHKTRDLIIANMREYLMNNSIVLHSAPLVDEMLDFSSDDGGRFEGQASNDDRVFAMMIGSWCAHDSDFGKAARLAPRPDSQRNLPKIYYLFDSLNRFVGQTEDLERAIEVVGQKQGWRYQESVARRDFANTDFSPIHDRNSIRHDMVYERNIPAEVIMYADIESAPVVQDSDDDWKNY